MKDVLLEFVGIAIVVNIPFWILYLYIRHRKLKRKQTRNEK